MGIAMKHKIYKLRLLNERKDMDQQTIIKAVMKQNISGYLFFICLMILIFTIVACGEMQNGTTSESIDEKRNKQDDLAVEIIIGNATLDCLMFSKGGGKERCQEKY